MERRQALMFGLATPVTVSSSWMHRRVVERGVAHVAADGPRRCHDAGHPEPEPDRVGVCRRRLSIRQGCRRAPWEEDVVEEPVVLVVDQARTPSFPTVTGWRQWRRACWR